MASVSRNKDQTQQLQDQGLLGSEIVTGEGVALELPAATVTSRIVAGALDWFIYLIGLISSIITIAYFSSAMSYPVIVASITGSIALWVWIIPGVVTGLSRGRSVGKLVTHTRVVRSDGGVITMRHAMIRATIGIFEIWLTQGALGFFVMIFSSRGQRFGDMLADTYVVRWPKARSYDLTIAMPPALLPWAQIASTREIPGGLTLNIISHFKTASKLLPDARLQEARVLAAAAERYVSPAPPWGTPPEDFLAAVIVMRNRVEFTRNAAIRERHERIARSADIIPFQQSPQPQQSPQTQQSPQPQQSL